ncbi:MAG: conjugal transfer protein TrbF [Pseudomonadota bacterium]|nr:hypothetical protein [Gammaproteobacteria bacterium]MBU1558715.1 hypothetical protein [Gammaproteobacteria bacterium]MBU1628915.1 hypothetical protein [Gammaproteobacteria bacterium]MBU1926912.1 hypothetical protein [Gammaproteobacteria bacterium]MBU2545740.1 hypothetical protein [Gammaproteobacteria bacterium]
MKNVFNKQPSNNQQAEVKTPYQRAKQEWDHRIGTVAVQAKNWRFIALLSLLVAVITLVLLIFSLSMDSNRVFVAEVSNSGRVVNVVPLQKVYEPSDAQKEYFISQFIRFVREVPLDPVVAKKQWLSAYDYLNQRGATILNAYFKANNPAELLGKQTVTLKILDINPMSTNAYQVDWRETSVDNSGQVLGKKDYSGVFTFQMKQPTTQEAILKNPLGIYISDFHISPRETESANHV